ncbi:N-terminal Xaa-Pro-Lys N-methyltransferase 1-B-like isoform X2 [Dendronephthya gigantea]|uniref:N-terminal Xaa-Pro-Lys N-methyltransferase 1-B-like isoform X2 n=1 Tax=Dendronephthya gigantea TaxID=151771 RepID=UPI00106BFECC|nr:N-terminal Xaa-Pro-Lys N-methyltransferase 1-B-like isoform X2 [Dendronephthya gigantea]
MATEPADDDSRGSMENPEKWYGDAQEFWKNVSPTVDGMLGGHAYVSPTDIYGSNEFINDFLEKNGGFLNNSYALDCGAGIGRVTKHFLLPLFQKVDMVEQDKTFVDQAPAFLGEKNYQKIGEIFCSGLQDFTPAAKRYSLIWIQWVLLYLTDDDLVEFLQKCQTALLPNGLICLKENVASKRSVTDREDSSITRTDKRLKKLFVKAGLNVIKQDVQKGFPKGLFKVKMYALRP